MTDSLGAILSGARSRLGWSLRAAEKATGINNAHLSQIETGAIGRPGITVLAKLATAYGIPASRLAKAAGYDSRWLPVPQRRSLGYVVAVRNQASGQFEDVNSTVLHPDEADACWERDLMTSEAADSGRRERYVVCEVIPVEDDDA